MRRSLSIALFAVVALGVAGTVVAAKPPLVKITSPKHRSTVQGSNVLVRFEAYGIRIVPASGVKEDGKAHHHLFVDTDVTAAGEVIPKTAQIYHLGSGADTLRLENLTPGKHRLIAVLAWGTHVPVAGARQDTVEFTVAP